MPNPEYRAFGSSDMSKAATAKGGNWTDMFNDPNFINFLAGTGARMDPEGVGGALGGATQEWVQGEQAGKAATAQRDEQREMFALLVEAMKGKNKVKIDRDGGISIDPTPSLGKLNEAPEQNKEKIDGFGGGIEGSFTTSIMSKLFGRKGG